MRHLMIDIETLGTAPDAPIVAVGSVFFEPGTGKQGSEFYAKIDFQSNFDAGRLPSGDTLAWWLKQSDDARKSIIPDSESYPLDAVLEAFASQTNTESQRPVVWSNGASFDVVLLEHAFQALRIQTPWKFWDVRDVRTIVDLASPAVKKNQFPFKGTQHNALDDAKHQATYVSAMWQYLKGIK